MRSFISIALAAAIPALVSAANLTVNVGANGQLAYDPPSLNASMGDFVSFVFQSKNHSVYTSTFADPCTPSPSGGFSTPFFPVNGSNGPFPSFTINISQSGPIWFYCAQTSPANHCKAGMVGVINPTADKTFAAFQAAAMGNSTNTTSSTGSPAGSAAPAATSAHSNSAIRLSGGAALLTLASVVAGLTAL